MLCWPSQGGYKVRWCSEDWLTVFSSTSCETTLQPHQNPAEELQTRTTRHSKSTVTLTLAAMVKKVYHIYCAVRNQSKTARSDFKMFLEIILTFTLELPQQVLRILFVTDSPVIYKSQINWHHLPCDFLSYDAAQSYINIHGPKGKLKLFVRLDLCDVRGDRQHVLFRGLNKHTYKQRGSVSPLWWTRWSLKTQLWLILKRNVWQFNLQYLYMTSRGLTESRPLT